MNQRTWEIYTLSDPRTDVVRYVGVTFRARRRFNEHLSRAMNGGGTYRDCWIRSLVNAGIRPAYQVIEQGQGAGWQDRERFWIAHYRIEGKLTNLTDGGDGTPGLPPSEKCRQAVSLAHKGIPYPPGRASAMLGKNHTPEALEKIRAAGTGRKHSELTKAKLSRARKGKKPSPKAVAASVAARTGKKLTEDHKRKISDKTVNRKMVLVVETGKVFDSITAASQSLMVSEASINQAIRKGFRCKGNHLRFL